MCTVKYLALFEKGNTMKYCLLEMSHEQQVVDNAVERGRWYWGMQAGMRIFRELWLEKRGAGLRVVVFGLRTTCHSFWKQVGPIGGRQPGMFMNL
jgi:hypothetical protein